MLLYRELLELRQVVTNHRSLHNLAIVHTAFDIKNVLRLQEGLHISELFV